VDEGRLFVWLVARFRGGCFCGKRAVVLQKEGVSLFQLCHTLHLGEEGEVQAGEVQADTKVCRRGGELGGALLLEDVERVLRVVEHNLRGIVEGDKHARHSGVRGGGWTDFRISSEHSSCC